MYEIGEIKEFKEIENNHLFCTYAQLCGLYREREGMRYKTRKGGEFILPPWEETTNEGKWGVVSFELYDSNGVQWLLNARIHHDGTFRIIGIYREHEWGKWWGSYVLSPI